MGDGEDAGEGVEDSEYDGEGVGDGEDAGEGVEDSEYDGEGGRW